MTDLGEAPVACADPGEPPTRGQTRRGPRGDGRQALLQAGLDALAELTATELIAGIGARELARRAGVTSAAFYHHFPSLEAYVTALVQHVYDPDRLQADELVAARLAQVVRSELPVEQGHALHELELRRLVADPEFRVRVGLWALGGRTVDRAYARFLAEVDDRIVAALGSLVRSWGLEVRPPFDLATVVAAQVALAQGVVVRHLIDPERLPLDQAKRVATALTFQLLRSRGDARTVDDRLAEINYYPLRRRSGGPGAARASSTRARILDAAGGLFGTLGFAATTVGQIARRAGMAQDTVYAHFGSKHQVAVELFLAQAADHLRGEGSDGLRGHLERLGAFVGLRSDTAPRYLAGLLTGEAEHPDDAVLATTRAAVTAAAAEGLLVDDDLDGLAVDLVLAVVRRVLERPADGPAAAADHACRLLLDGAAPR